MFRVAHVITKLELGGAQQNTLYTVQHIDQTLFKPYLLYGPGGILTENARALPHVETYEIPHLVRPIHPLADMMALFELIRVFRKIRPHIVHTHSSKAGILGRWAATFTGVPIRIHSIHGYGITPLQSKALRTFLIMLERWTARVTDFFIAVSHENRQWGIEHNIFPPEKCTVIRSGIQLSKFRTPPLETELDNLRKEIGIDKHTPVIGMVACLKPQKDPLTFARIARVLHQQEPTYHFVLIGDGELRPELEKFIATHGLKDVFHLMGWRTDVEKWMHLFDVLVLTSLWEGLPRVLPEALSAGTPVIASAVNGVLDILQHERNAWVIPPRDVDAFVSAIMDALHHPEKGKTFVDRAKTLLDEFDIDAMVRQQEKLYLSLLQSKNVLKTSTSSISE